MKILTVTQGYTPAYGGTEWLVQQVSEQLVNTYGDDVTVFTTNCYNGEGFWTPSMPRMETGWSTINGVKIRRFPVASRVSQLLRPAQKIFFRLGLPFHDWMRTYFGGPIIYNLRREIARQPADIISAASFPLLHMFEAVRGARASRRPVALTGALHPQDPWGFGRENIYRAIREADIYFALTDYEIEYLATKGISKEKIAVVGCGVTPSQFDTIDPVEARRKFGLPTDRPIVGFIGQIGQHKGIDTLAKAMPLVWERFPEAHLLIAGSRAMFAKQLDSIIASWPESYRSRTTLVFNFKDEEKRFLFNAPDVFVYPSGFESFGISYLEAWAARKPVIGTWSGAIPHVVDAGRDGLLTPFQKHDHLAEAILLMLKYPVWATSMGEAGYQKVISRFTWEKVASRYRQAYTGALPPDGSAKG